MPLVVWFDSLLSFLYFSAYNLRLLHVYSYNLCHRPPLYVSLYIYIYLYHNLYTVTSKLLGFAPRVHESLKRRLSNPTRAHKTCVGKLLG